MQKFNIGGQLGKVCVSAQGGDRNQCIQVPRIANEVLWGEMKEQECTIIQTMGWGKW